MLPGSESPPTTVPENALTRLDGVEAGYTWDHAFVHHYRFLCVCNDAASGQRRTYVDGALFHTGAATTAAISPQMPLTMFAGCRVRVAQYIFWNDKILSQDEIDAQTSALRETWKQPTVVKSTAQVLGVVPIPETPYNILPVGLPACDCWLDACHAASLYVDAAGTTKASPGQAVRLWKDRSGKNRHVTFPNKGAQWSGSATDWIGKLPVVNIRTTGTFSVSPVKDITVNSGYTIVAVWRMSTVSAGHPLSIRSGSTFTEAAWEECIDTTSSRVMPPPSSFGATNTEAVMALWMRSGRDVWFSVQAGGSTGRIYTGTSDPESWTAGAAVQVGSGLSLAELLVWPFPLSSNDLSKLNTQHLMPRYGGILPTPANENNAMRVDMPVVIPIGFPVSVPTPICWFTASVKTNSLFADDAGTTPSAPGQPVRLWRDRSGNGRHLHLTSAVWSDNPSECINGRNPVRVVSAGATFSSSALAGITPSTGYTILAVWRLVVGAATTGHPVVVRPGATFSTGAWTETIDTALSRQMPSPALPDDATILATWTRSDKNVTFSVLANGVKRVWTASDSLAEDWTAGATPSVGPGILLAELVVWPVPLSQSGAPKEGSSGPPGRTVDRRKCPILADPVRRSGPHVKRFRRYRVRAPPPVDAEPAE